MIGSIIYLAIVVIVIAGMWKTFEKAGQPGSRVGDVSFRFTTSI